MDKTAIQEIVKIGAEEVKRKMAGGTLYGEPIDIDDPHAVIYAAYLLGQRECSERLDKITKLIE